MRVRLMASSDDLMPWLLGAMNWRDDKQWTALTVMATPELAHYAVDWMRPGDAGLVAEFDDHSVGAAWWRTFTSQDPGYGYVADDVPEVGLAVHAEHRGRGIGRTLIEALVSHGRTVGLRALSISVEDGNAPARTLYESVGFVTVGRSGDSDTLLLSLD